MLTVAEPEGKIPFVNVTYAGFIGSVTGMNAKHVSIGEMGGGGRGHWAGVPMALLVRMALEEADDLDAAIAVFRDHPRTCEYYLRDRRRQLGQGRRHGSLLGQVRPRQDGRGPPEAARTPSRTVSCSRPATDMRSSPVA